MQGVRGELLEVWGILGEEKHGVVGIQTGWWSGGGLLDGGGVMPAMGGGYDVVIGGGCMSAMGVGGCATGGGEGSMGVMGGGEG